MCFLEQSLAEYPKIPSRLLVILHKTELMAAVGPGQGVPLLAEKRNRGSHVLVAAWRWGTLPKKRAERRRREGMVDKLPPWQHLIDHGLPRPGAQPARPFHPRSFVGGTSPPQGKRSEESTALLEEFWHIHIIKFGLQELQEEREIQNGSIVLEGGRGIRTTIETGNERRDGTDNLGL